MGQIRSLRMNLRSLRETPSPLVIPYRYDWCHPRADANYHFDFLGLLNINSGAFRGIWKPTIHKEKGFPSQPFLVYNSCLSSLPLSKKVSQRAN